MNSMEQCNYEVGEFIGHTIDILKNLDLNNQIYEVVQKVSLCRGKIITTGMGKNYHIAQKVSSTFNSLKIPSCVLHPGEAMHGDSGIMSEHDILLVFSTSGKTDEIIKVIEVSRILGINCVISLTSHSFSPIKKMSDLFIDVGEIKEAGYLGLAPTTSTLVMLLVGDIIATLVAKEKMVTVKDYHDRHHNGYLGEKSAVQ